MKQKTLPVPADGRTAGLKLSDNKYHGPLPDFTGQLRCHIGYDHQDRDICILIPEALLKSRQKKYPNLYVLGIV